MTRIYVSGPYSRGDPCINTNAAIAVGNKLMDNGLIPFIPHLSHFWHTATPRAYEDWMKIDFAFVEVCDALYRMPGESPGGDREVALAQSLGIPVYYDLDAVIAAYPKA